VTHQPASRWDDGTGNPSSPPGTPRADAPRDGGVTFRGAALTTVAVGAITLVAAMAAIGTWPAGVFQDDGIYVVLAKALATGRGYRYLNIPGAPYGTHYPPAYPAFLALLWKLSPTFPANVALFTFTNAFFLAIAASGAHYFGRVRLRLGNAAAAVVALATVACVPALMFGVFVLSEPMFMALLFPVLLLAERAGDTGRSRDALIAGVAGGAFAMVRTMGQFVLPALVLVLVARRRWRSAAATVAGGAAFLLPWHVWVAAHAREIPPVLVGKYGPYSQWLGEGVRANGLGFVIGVVIKNLQSLVGTAWTMFSGSRFDAAPPSLIVSAAVALSLLALLTLGALRVRRDAPVTLGFVGMYIALVILWPFEPTRFLWALLPLFGLIITAAVRVIWEWRPAPASARVVRLGAIATTIVLVAGYATYNVRGVAQRTWDRAPRENTARATPFVEWVRRFSNDGDVLATDDDALLHLYTGRPTVPVGTLTAQEYLTAQTYDFASQALVRLMDRYKPRYVLCSTRYGVMAARPLLTGEHPRLRLVATLPHGFVFATAQQ
jgi:hypothetical protein